MVGVCSNAVWRIEKRCCQQRFSHSPIMSRNPSPAPPSAPASRSKHKSYTPIGITAGAGADDVKYQAKYKELKRKVKDIENVRRAPPTSFSLFDACSLSRTMTSCT